MEKILEFLDKFFDLIKWPYFIGYALLYNYGLNEYIVLDMFWFFCGFLIAKDLYKKYQEEQAKKEETKE